MNSNKQKPQTRKELAAAYNVSLRTLARWFIRAGLVFDKTRVFTPKQIQLIFEKLGTP